MRAATNTRYNVKQTLANHAASLIAESESVFIEGVSDIALAQLNKQGINVTLVRARAL